MLRWALSLALDILCLVRCERATLDLDTDSWGHEDLRHQKRAGGTGAGRLRYLPAVHAQAVGEAFDTVLAEGGHLVEVLKRYRQAGMQKKTHGTCKHWACHAWRGKTDCLGGECLCQDGHGTVDGDKCIKHYAMPFPEYQTDTGGTCNWWSGCKSWRGPTHCDSGRCICKDGYVANDGECVLPVHLDPARDIVYTMLSAGVREPDELPCPGDTFEEGSMGGALLKMAQGEEHFNVSLCRTATQVYHASPLPLVDASDLREPPIANGYDGKDNSVRFLYSVMTNRQWRTQMVQVMATEFVYAIAMPDLGEGAKRLGNIFHTLSDSFSGSHLQRAGSEADVSATSETCGALEIQLPMSMDVMNFAKHPFADMAYMGLLFECSRLYEAAAMRLWAEARLAGVADLSAANAWVDRIVREVFCPALPLAPAFLDHPAAGASGVFSVAGTKPALPVGTTTERDANHIVRGWASGLAAGRAKERPDKQRAYPHGLVLPPRAADVCADAALAHVEARHFEAARNSELPPQYLQPHF